MSSLACKNVKIQDSTGAVVSTIAWNGTNITIDKPVLATAPTAQAGTNTTQLATTAFAYGALSASTNGYQKLPSGLIIQWGTIYFQNATVAFTYPITFPNSCVVATGSIYWNGNSPTLSLENAPTSTSATFRSSQTGLYAYVVAIGY
jgi:hypothetical protein